MAIVMPLSRNWDNSAKRMSLATCAPTSTSATKACIGSRCGKKPPSLSRKDAASKAFAPARLAQPQGDSLHHRLDVIREEAHDMAAQHGGGVSADEQRVLNQELDGASRIIGE